MSASPSLAGVLRSQGQNQGELRDTPEGATSGFSASPSKNAGNGSGNGSNLVDASALAAFLGVSRAYVYEHSAELGAIPLGAGARPRLRFDRDLALERLTACSLSRGSGQAVSRTVEPQQRRKQQRPLDSDVLLLPIRGPRVPRVTA